MKIVFTDGYEGVVDLRPLIARGQVFAWLQRPENFGLFHVDEFGHSIYWMDSAGQQIDLSADSLRRDAMLQEEQHRLIAG